MRRVRGVVRVRVRRRASGRWGERGRADVGFATADGEGPRVRAKLQEYVAEYGHNPSNWPFVRFFGDLLR